MPAFLYPWRGGLKDKNMERPTTEFTLKCGWKVWIVNYWLQSDYDSIQGIAFNELNIEGGSNVETKNDYNYKISGKVVREMTDLSKTLAIKKILLQDGTVYEGEKLTLELIKSVPYDPDIGDELKTLIDEHLSKKKQS